MISQPSYRNGSISFPLCSVAFNRPRPDGGIDRIGEELDARRREGGSVP
jgi:hypothetical protein